MKVYYNKINALLIEQRLKKKELFQELNISRQTFWNWEYGKTFPSESAIRKTANYFKVKITDISDLKPIVRKINLVGNYTEYGEFEINLKAQLNKLFSDLKSKNFQLDAMMNFVNTRIYIKDSKNQYIKANNAFMSLVSSEIENIEGSVDENIFNQSDAEKNSTRDLKVMQTKERLIIEDYTPNTRKKKYCRMIKTPILDKDLDCVGIVSTFVDITEQREKEFTQNIFHDSLLNHDKYGVILKELNTDGKEKYIYFSKKAEEILTYTVDEFKNNPLLVYKTVYPEDSEEVFRESDRAKIIHEKFEKDYRIITKNGEIRWVHECMTWSQDKITEKHYYLILLSDITDELKKKNTLERLTKMLSLNEHSAFWIKKQSSKVHDYTNPMFEKIYTYPVEYFQDNSNFWFEIIIPEDQEEMKKHIENSKKHHVSDTYKYSINTSDGEIKKLESKITWDYDKDAGEWYYLGITDDITS